MIRFSYVALALALACLAAMAITVRRGTWKQHMWKIFGAALAGVVLAVIGLIGVWA